MTEMRLWIVVMDKESSPRLEVRVLVPIQVSGVREDRVLATRTALNTPLPLDAPVEKRDGQTARELGYSATRCYMLQDVRFPQVVAWYY